jgi:hypothetical protein
MGKDLHSRGNGGVKLVIVPDRIQFILKWVLFSIMLFSVYEKAFLFLSGMLAIFSGEESGVFIGGIFSFLSLLGIVLFIFPLVGIIKNRRWAYYFIVLLLLKNVVDYLEADQLTKDPFILIMNFLPAVLAAIFIIRDRRLSRQNEAEQAVYNPGREGIFIVIVVSILIQFGADFLYAKFSSIPAPVDQALMDYVDSRLDSSINTDNLLFFENSVKEIIKEKIHKAIRTGDTKQLAPVVGLEDIRDWIKYETAANYSFELPEDFENVDLVTGAASPFDSSAVIHVFVWPEALSDGESALIKIESVDQGTQSGEGRKMRQPTRVMPEGALHFAMEVEPKIGCRIDFLMAETKSLVFDTCGLSDEIVYEIINLAVIEPGE